MTKDSKERRKAKKARAKAKAAAAGGTKTATGGEHTEATAALVGKMGGNKVARRQNNNKRPLVVGDNRKGEKEKGGKAGTLVEKKKKEEEEEQQQPPAVERERRDFAGDLNAYLASWSHDKQNWKFSKVLQTWALENLLDKRRIDKELFRKFLPYAESIQGAARERLLAKVNKAILDDEADKVVDMDLKRAQIIKQRLSSEEDEEDDSGND